VPKNFDPPPPPTKSFRNGIAKGDLVCSDGLPIYKGPIPYKGSPNSLLRGFLGGGGTSKNIIGGL